MKYLHLISLSFFITTLFGQVEVSHRHCHCIDYIEQDEPALHGKYEKRCNGALIESGEFVHGKKHGDWITYSKNGPLIRNFYYENGMLNGNIIVSYAKGNLKIRGAFLNGKKHGEWFYYNEDGDVLKSGSFVNGKPVGIWQHYKPGSKKVWVSYNFDTKKYIKKSEAIWLYNENRFMVNDNSGDPCIVLDETKRNEHTTMPFEGFTLANGHFINLLEVPVEIMHTAYKSYFTAKLTFVDSQLDSITVGPYSQPEGNPPQLKFFIATNLLEKMLPANHKPLTQKLMEYKIKEALSLMGPWIVDEESISLIIPFVVNDPRILKKIDPKIWDTYDER